MTYGWALLIRHKICNEGTCE